jgi:hypothetical protein
MVYGVESSIPKALGGCSVFLSKSETIKCFPAKIEQGIEYRYTKRKVLLLRKNI